MVAIACGLASKNCTSQKCFAPQSDQALWIQIFGVECPDAHALLVASNAALTGARDSLARVRVEQQVRPRVRHVTRTLARALYFRMPIVTR